MRLGVSKSRIRKLAIAAFGIFLLTAAASPLAATAAQPKLYAVENMTLQLDGRDVPITDKWRIKSNRLYAPIAVLAEMFGAEVKWDKANEEATFKTAGGDTIVLGNGVPVVYFNGARYVLDAAPFLADGRMYVMLRNAAEMMDAKVDWREAERTASLTTKPPVIQMDAAPALGDSEPAEAQEGDAADGAPAQAPAAESDKAQVQASGDAEAVAAPTRFVVPSFFAHEAEPFTDKDLQLLAKITEVEAGNESYAGQLAVANVILNRVKDPRFPDTIKDVIYSGQQFPPAHNGLLDKAVPDAVSLRAAKDALNGKNNVENAVYFYNPKVSKGAFWKSLDTVTTIGSHRFAK